MLLHEEWMDVMKWNNMSHHIGFEDFQTLKKKHLEALERND